MLGLASLRLDRMNNTEIVVVGLARTPIGSFQGALSSMSAPKLGAQAIKAALERAGVKPDQVSEVIMGNVLTAVIGQAPARQAAIYAGIPTSVPALTINKVCGSGMKAVKPAGIDAVFRKAANKFQRAAAIWPEKDW